MIIIFLPLPLGGGVGERWTLRKVKEKGLRFSKKWKL